jgi:TolB-like protein/LysM repeat protein
LGIFFASFLLTYFYLSFEGEIIVLFKRIIFYLTIVGPFLFLNGCGETLLGSGVKAEKNSSQAVSKSSKTTPGWVVGRENSKYTDSFYLTGVGFSEKNYVSANESARAELAKNFKVRIQSILRDYSSVNKSRTELAIETQVDMILEGVEIRDGWYEAKSKVYYSLAVLDRKVASSLADGKIKNISQKLNNLLISGKNAEENGHVLDALRFYASGYEKTSQLASLTSAKNVITRSSKPREPPDTTDFGVLIRQIVSGVNIQIVSGNNQKLTRFKGLTEPLVAQILTTSSGKAISGIPVKLIYEEGDGDIDYEVISNIDGIVSATVRTVNSFKEKSHTVSAQIDYEKIISQFDRQIVQTFLTTLKNKKVNFSYSINLPKWATNKSLKWKQGLTELVNQVIQNLPPGGSPSLGIFGFRDLRLNRPTPFSRILKEDFSTLMVQVEDLEVKSLPPNKNELSTSEFAQESKLDYYVTGSYRLERGGLEMRAQLIRTKTGNIVSSGYGQIEREEIHTDDLAEIDSPSASFTPIQDSDDNNGDEYDFELNRLVSGNPKSDEFGIKVYADKKDYQIGENLVFTVTAKKNCYLTILDVGANGDITVIFPNAYKRSNFIKAGEKVKIPTPDYNFNFNILGPPGLERIRALATKSPEFPIKLNLQNGFHSISKQGILGLKSVKALAGRFNTRQSKSWGGAYTEFFIHEKNQIYMRGSRKVSVGD